MWDVGNVFVRWDPRTLYSKIFSDPAQCDRFLAEVCTMAWHSRHDRGLPFDDGIAELTARFPHHAAAIAAWKGRWWEMFSGAIPQTEACVADLHRRGVPQYGLSNMSLEVWDGVRAMSPALDLLADVVISAREGLIKPEPEIYALACARAGLAPGELLFVDDSLVNIEAAQDLGFDTHHFADPDALRPALEARGLLEAPHECLRLSGSAPSAYKALMTTTRPAATLPDAALDGLIERAAGNPAALANLAYLLLARGDKERAVALARQAVEAAPDDMDVCTLGGIVLSAGVANWHFQIVHDEVRNKVYEESLRRAVSHGAKVLDIGSGTGLLALMAARAGAGDVITCEMNPPIADAARRIVALNGYDDRVRVVSKKSTALDLDADLGGRVDLIVSEIISDNLLGEGMLPATEDAVRRLLKPGGQVIPSHGQVRIALAHYAKLDPRRMGEVEGFDLTPFNHLAERPRPISVGDKALLLRSEAVDLFQFDFQSGGPFSPGRGSAIVTTSGGTINGVAQWIRLQLDSEGAYENRPGPGATSSWVARFYPLDAEIDPPPGTPITVQGAHTRETLRVWAEIP